MNDAAASNIHGEADPPLDRRVLDALAHAVVVTDTDGIITYMNPAAEELYGYPAGEAVGRRGSELMVPEETDEEARTIRSRVASGQASGGRIRLKKKDGSTFLARMQASPVRNKVGSVEGLVGMTWDVTEEDRTQRQAYAELEATEVLLDAIPDLVFQLGPKGEYRFVHADNPELLVRPAEELLGRRIQDVMPAEAAEQWMRAIERVTGGENSSRLEYSIETLTSEEHIFEAHLAPVPNDGVVAVARDITEFKRVQAALRAERDRFIEIVEQAPVLMAVLRGPDHVFEFANEQYYQLVGRRELIGKTVVDALPEVKGQGFLPLLDRVYATGEPFVGTEIPAMVHTDPELPPEEHILNLNYIPLRDGADAVTGILAHGVDITEQIVVRRRLQARNDIIDAVLKAKSAATTARVALDGFAESIPADLSAVVLFTEDSPEIIPLSVLRTEGKQEELKGLAVRDDLPPDVDPDTPGTWHFRSFDDMGHGGPFIDGLKEDGLKSLLVRTLSDGRDCTGMILFSAKLPFREEHESLCEELAESLAVAIRSARMMEEIEDARIRLEALNLKLVRTQEEERRTLALELHDHVGQVLTSVLFALHDFDEAKVPEDMLRSLKRSRALIMDLAAQIRSLSLDLRPPMLDDFGLKSTLEWYRNKVAQETGVEVNLSTAGISDDLLPEATRTTAFRVIQEALTNVARHAGVSKASVKVLRRDDRLLIRIRDEGRGFDPEALRGRVAGGLSGMVERVRLIDGEVNVESEPGKGTTVIATIPIPS